MYSPLALPCQQNVVQPAATTQYHSQCILCHVTFRHATLCHFRLCHVTLQSVTLRHVTLSTLSLERTLRQAFGNDFCGAPYSKKNGRIKNYGKFDFRSMHVMSCCVVFGAMFTYACKGSPLRNYRVWSGPNYEAS